MGSEAEKAHMDFIKEVIDELREMLAWANQKLHHIEFSKQEDALMQDRIKLFLEHGEF